MERVSCKHCGCNRSFMSELAMLQHFAASHACTNTSTYNHAATDQHHVSSCADPVLTDSDRVYYLRCHKCGRSFNSKPALEQHCRDTSHGIAAMLSSPPQQRLTRIIRRQLPDVSIKDLSLRLIVAAMTLIRVAMTLIGVASHGLIMVAMTLIGAILALIGSTHDVVGTHNKKDPIKNNKEIMVSCDDCGDSFKSFDALHQHRWDKPYHTRVSRRRTPVFGSNVRECSQCEEVFRGADELEQHFIRAHPLTEISTSWDERSTDTWVHVAEKFMVAWKRPVTAADPSPVVHKILKVNNMGGRRRKHEEYRAEVKTQVAQIKQLEADVRRRVLEDGNQLQRYHGTTVKCDMLARLLQSGAGTWPSDRDLLCSIDGCGLCGILEDGFRTAKCRVSRFQRFGRGIYVSATSSKADDYVRMYDHDNDASNLKVMLVTKVLAGCEYPSTHNLTHLRSPPPGFHSVRGVPGIHSVLNYDELVLYDDRAILPDYIIVYSLNHVGAPLG